MLPLATIVLVYYYKMLFALLSPLLSPSLLLLGLDKKGHETPLASSLPLPVGPASDLPVEVCIHNITTTVVPVNY